MYNHTVQASSNPKFHRWKDTKIHRMIFITAEYAFQSRTSLASIITVYLLFAHRRIYILLLWCVLIWERIKVIVVLYQKIPNKYCWLLNNFFFKFWLQSTHLYNENEIHLNCSNLFWFQIANTLCFQLIETTKKNYIYLDKFIQRTLFICERSNFYIFYIDHNNSQVLKETI